MDRSRARIASVWGAKGVDEVDFKFSVAAKEIVRVAVAHVQPAPPKDKACAGSYFTRVRLRAGTDMDSAAWAGMKLALRNRQPCRFSRRSEIYYSAGIMTEINNRLSVLSGVNCTLDVTADSGSTVAAHVYAAIGQGARLRTGLSPELRASIKPTGCKLMILSRDQWVSSTERLQLYSCARRNDNDVKVEHVRKSVRSVRRERQAATHSLCAAGG